MLVFFFIFMPVMLNDSIGLNFSVGGSEVFTHRKCIIGVARITNWTQDKFHGLNDGLRIADHELWSRGGSFIQQNNMNKPITCLLHHFICTSWPEILHSAISSHSDLITVHLGSDLNLKLSSMDVCHGELWVLHLALTCQKHGQRNPNFIPVAKLKTTYVLSSPWTK